MAIIQNLKKPAPRWFRITKKVLSLTLNTVISVMLIMGYTSESPILLVIKLAESYIMNLLDSVLSNGEVYAMEDTKTDTLTVTKTSVDTTTPYSAPNDEELSNK